MFRLFVFGGILIIARIGAAAGFTCPGVGDFPDTNDCKVIHKCKSKGSEANDFLCPPGTIFDQKCVWPHATRRRCDSSESEGPPTTGEETEARHRSLFRGDSSRAEPTKADKDGDLVTTELNLSIDAEGSEHSIKEPATSEMATSTEISDVPGDSLTESGDDSESSDEASEIPDAQLSDKKFYVASRGFSTSTDGNEGETSTNPTGARKVFEGRVQPSGSEAEPSDINAAKTLPVLEGGRSEGVSKERFEVGSRSIEDPLAGIRECLEKLVKASNDLYDQLLNRVSKARLNGSRMLVNASNTVENRLDHFKTSIMDGLNAQTALFDDTIAGNLEDIKEAAKTVGKAMDASRSLGLAAVETALGLTADVVQSGRSVSSSYLGNDENVFNGARTLPNIELPNPFKFVKTTRDRILRAVAKKLRSTAETIEGWTSDDR